MKIVNDICEFVAEYHGTNTAFFMNNRKSPTRVKLRRQAIALCKTYTDLATTEVAEQFQIDKSVIHRAEHLCDGTPEFRFLCRAYEEQQKRIA